MKETHGGVYATAAASGLHFTMLYSFLKGGTLLRPNASRLRAALPSVAADVWADAFAPSAPDEAVA